MNWGRTCAAQFFALSLLLASRVSNDARPESVDPTVAAAATTQPPTASTTTTVTTSPASASAAPAPSSTRAPAIEAIIPVAEGPIVLAASDAAVWVEAHRANILTVIDPEKNAEIEQLEDVPVHCSLRAAGDAVWATEFSGGTVTRVDAVTHDVVGTVELDDACGLAVRDDDPRVTSPGMGKVVRYDTATLSFRRGRAGTGPRRRAVAAC